MSYTLVFLTMLVAGGQGPGMSFVGFETLEACKAMAGEIFDSFEQRIEEEYPVLHAGWVCVKIEPVNTDPMS